jgi:PAS domain S-box-containing protein
MNNRQDFQDRPRPTRPASAPFIRLDRALRIVQLDRAAAAAIGRPADALVGRALLEVAPVLRRTPLPAAAREAIASGQGFAAEGRCGPLRRWYAVRGRPDAQGLWLHFEDVSARYAPGAPEPALAHCEQRLHCLAEHAPVLTLDVDPQGRIAAVNPELRRRLGYAPDALIGQPLHRLLPDWDAPGLLDELAATQATHEVVARHGEGGRCELAAKVRRLSLAGRTTGYLLMARDMTAARRGLRQLRVQAEVIDRTHDAVVVLDGSGCVLSWNRSAERLYGRPARSMTGQAFEQVFEAAERARLQAAIDRTAFDAEAPTEFELGYRDTQGRWVRLALRLSRIAGVERGHELVLVFGIEAGARRAAARAAAVRSDIAPAGP